MLLPKKRKRDHGPASAYGSRHRPGRPMKRTSELTPSRQSRTQQSEVLHKHLKSDKEAAKRAHLSLLESLPVELIELIFFYCLEMNLPKASPHLARSLSKPSISSALVLFAYFDDDGENPVETHHFLPAAYRQISLDDRIRLQQGILGCGWCTLEFLKSCMPTLSRLQMVQAWHRDTQAEENLPSKFRTTGPVQGMLRSRFIFTSVIGLSFHDTPLPEDYQGKVTLPALSDQAGMERHFMAKFEPPGCDLPRAEVIGPTGDNNYLPRIISRQLPSHVFQHPDRLRYHAWSVLAARAFPDHILRGNPWTDAKIARLQLLRQGMRFLTSDPFVVLSAEAMFQGMADAIREGNEMALLVLVELHVAVVKYDPPLANTSGREDWSDDHSCYNLRRPLPLWLFHLACKQADPKATESRSRRDMVSPLLLGGIEAVPSDDEKLTRWATRTKMHGSSKVAVSHAKWLLHHLELHGQCSTPANMLHSMYRWRCSYRDTMLAGKIGYITQGVSLLAHSWLDKHP